eukprot:scaffold7781_cov23-Tisochrysis_lutea.AAC.1
MSKVYHTCVKAPSQVTLPPSCCAAARPSLYMRDTSRVRAAVMAWRSCVMRSRQQAHKCGSNMHSGDHATHATEQ